MKGRMTLSIALALSAALLPLLSSDSAARAQQQPQGFRADTGVVALGPNQKLRVTVNGMGGNDALTVRFRRIAYEPDEACGDQIAGACKLTVASQSTSAPVTLASGEAVFQDLLVSSFGRVVVLSNSRDVRVTAQIIDGTTGQVNSIIGILIAL